MKFALIALALLVSAPTFALSLTCEGTHQDQAVKVVVNINDDALVTDATADVAGTQVLAFTSEQLMAGEVEVPLEGGGSVPGSLVVSGTQELAIIWVQVADDAAVAGAFINTETIKIDGADLACVIAD